MNSTPSDFELIDSVISIMYNKGDDRKINVPEYLKNQHCQFENERAYERFISKLVETKWVNLSDNGDCLLNKQALHLLDEYKSYRIFYQEQASILFEKWNQRDREVTKKKSRETFEFILKNSAAFVAIILSLSTVLVTIISIFDKQELRSIEQEVKELKKAQDTLIQRLSTPQGRQQLTPVPDIPTK